MGESMRIGIACYPTHGGSGVVATELGKHLAERGHEVAFISYAAPLRLAELPPRVSFHEVEIEEYPLLRHFPYALALASKMKTDYGELGSQGSNNPARDGYHPSRE